MFKLFLKRSGFSRMLAGTGRRGCGAAEAKIRSVVPRSDAAGYDRDVIYAEAKQSRPSCRL